MGVRLRRSSGTLWCCVFWSVVHKLHLHETALLNSCPGQDEACRHSSHTGVGRRPHGHQEGAEQQGGCRAGWGAEQGGGRGGGGGQQQGGQAGRRGRKGGKTGRTF